MSDTFKIILSVDSTHLEMLDKLCDMGGCERKELVNSAITLMEWAMAEITEGSTIGSIDEKRKVYREVQLPVLDTVVRKYAKLDEAT